MFLIVLFGPHFSHHFLSNFLWFQYVWLILWSLSCFIARYQFLFGVIAYGFIMYVLCRIENDHFSYRWNCFNFVCPVSFWPFKGNNLDINILNTLYLLYRWLCDNLVRIIILFSIFFWGFLGEWTMERQCCVDILKLFIGLVIKIDGLVRAGDDLNREMKELAK